MRRDCWTTFWCNFWVPARRQMIGTPACDFRNHRTQCLVRIWSCFSTDVLGSACGTLRCFDAYGGCLQKIAQRSAQQRKMPGDKMVSEWLFKLYSSKCRQNCCFNQSEFELATSPPFDWIVRQLTFRSEQTATQKYSCVGLNSDFVKNKERSS